jgi:hypothetical protein
MDGWKKQFMEKLGKAQQTCAKRFEDALDQAVKPAFEDLSQFLRDNGFKVSQPLTEKGRRSFKFELAENAYLLVLVRFGGLGELELRSEAFIPGDKPMMRRFVGGLNEVNPAWAEKQFRTALDQFIDLLAGKTCAADAMLDEMEELAAI